MSYLCTFDGTKKLTPYSTSDHFKEGESYILERKDLEYETDISICQYSSLQDINTKHGRIICLYQNLYYTEYLNELPTQFNNHRISGETFPITMTGNMPNVFSFMRKDPNDPGNVFPIAFMFLSDSENNWKYYSMEYETIKVCGSLLDHDLFLGDAPSDFLTFYCLEGEKGYRLKVSEEAQEKFFLMNNDNVLEYFENGSLLSWSKTYRFIYDDTYAFIIGGAFILYARL